MDPKQFRDFGRQMIDYVINYQKTVEKRRVISNVTPGYLAPLLPNEAPLKPENWQAIMDDMERVIMPGITHWIHPHFHAYFACAATFPGIVADIFSGAIGSLGFTWATSPVITELEFVCVDWLGRALGIPQKFLFKESKGVGGGAIMTSASESVLVPMMAARKQALNYIREKEGIPSDKHDGLLLPRVVMYTSMEAHSCVEKAAKICLTTLRIIETDEEYHQIRPDKLKEAMAKDKANGLHPAGVFLTLGTTGTAAFDSIKDIGPIVKEYSACWLHADGAYGGGSFICPEMRGPMKGMEYLDSFNFNPYKWLLINFDSSCLYTSSIVKLTSGLGVQPIYLEHQNQAATIDLRHWGIPLSRRFRSLKIWFTMRLYGIENMREYIRNHVKLAKEFEKLVRQDDRFEVANKVQASLVAFRLKGPGDELTTTLLAKINSEAKIHMIPTKTHGKYVIRFVVVAEKAKIEDIHYAWDVIKTHAEGVLKEAKSGKIRSPQNKILIKKYSFINPVSKDTYRKSETSSLEGTLPILVVVDDEDTHKSK